MASLCKVDDLIEVVCVVATAHSLKKYIGLCFFFSIRWFHLLKSTPIVDKDDDVENGCVEDRLIKFAEDQEDDDTLLKEEASLKNEPMELTRIINSLLDLKKQSYSLKS
ncbi:hypothetical protein QVD17_26060 [Tagetes erecta]|uniref:Uncharacterized protein n=1 Tax=Tagetes erecta TaxID=13708 RepID=A0AAD8NQG3_TARER|nr:hypothetical protein QVD17_26060 [Tagetes erecta]